MVYIDSISPLVILRLIFVPGNETQWHSIGRNWKHVTVVWSDEKFIAGELRSTKLSNKFIYCIANIYVVDVNTNP